MCWGAPHWPPRGAQCWEQQHTAKNHRHKISGHQTKCHGIKNTNHSRILWSCTLLVQSRIVRTWKIPEISLGCPSNGLYGVPIIPLSVCGIVEAKLIKVNRCLHVLMSTCKWKFLSFVDLLSHLSLNKYVQAYLLPRGDFHRTVIVLKPISSSLDFLLAPFS